METELFCSSCADIKESQVKHLIRSSYLGNVQWCWINMNELFLIRLVWVWDFFQLFLGYNGSKAKSQQPYITSLGKKLLSILPVVLFCFMFIVYNKKKKKNGQASFIFQSRGRGCGAKTTLVDGVSKWLAACTVIWETTKNMQSV